MHNVEDGRAIICNLEDTAESRTVGNVNRIYHRIFHGCKMQSLTKNSRNLPNSRLRIILGFPRGLLKQHHLLCRMTAVVLNGQVWGRGGTCSLGVIWSFLESFKFLVTGQRLEEEHRAHPIWIPDVAQYPTVCRAEPRQRGMLWLNCHSANMEKFWIRIMM